MEKRLTYIFSRPPLTALIVGVLIHFTLSLNYGMMRDNMMLPHASYWSSHFEEIVYSPFFGTLNFLIPFIVPLFVSSGAKFVGRIQTKKIMHQFPEMNPDIVMRYKRSGEIIYKNPVANKYLNNDHDSSKFTEMVLSSIHSLEAPHSISEQSIRLNKVFFDVTIKTADDINELFVSAKDVSKTRKLQNKITYSADLQEKLSNSLDEALNDFDPESFKLEDFRKKLVNSLIKINENDIGPNHIFIVEKDVSDRIFGYLFSRENSQIIMSDEVIELDSKSDLAVYKGADGVFWSNQKDSQLSVEDYQQQFHPYIRKSVGTIKHYATCLSGRTAVIAFYSGQQLDQLDGTQIKGIAIFSQVLMKISLESKATVSAFKYLINSLAVASEVNDEDTGDHIVRINEYSKVIAEQLGMDKQFVKEIHYAAQMHDVGKIHVSPNILKKNGPLTDEEFAKMQKHPEMGAKILGDSPRLKMAKEIAQNHHEKYNGRGYPEGLKGEAIPISARIVALVDVYDALRQKRVYKPAFSHEKAFDIITKGDGRTDPEEFDPKVLQAFIAVNNDMDKIFEDYQLA